MSRPLYTVIAVALITALSAAAGARAQTAPACGNPLAIGVSRVIEVDTTGGS